MKRRRPTSRQFKTAMYLHHACGKHTFTARDIHEAMRYARVYYHSLIPDHVLTERDRLLVEYDCVNDYDQTRTYMIDGHRSLGWDRLMQLRAALRKLFKPYVILVDVDWQTNTTAAEVSNMFKRGYIELVATKPYRTYRINPLYLEAK